MNLFPFARSGVQSTNMPEQGSTSTGDAEEPTFFRNQNQLFGSKVWAGRASRNMSMPHAFPHIKLGAFVVTQIPKPQANSMAFIDRRYLDRSF